MEAIAAACSTLAMAAEASSYGFSAPADALAWPAWYRLH